MRTTAAWRGALAHFLHPLRCPAEENGCGMNVSGICGCSGSEIQIAVEQITARLMA